MFYIMENYVFATLPELIVHHKQELHGTRQYQTLFTDKLITDDVTDNTQFWGTCIVNSVTKNFLISQIQKPMKIVYPICP